MPDKNLRLHPGLNRVEVEGWAIGAAALVGIGDGDADVAFTTDGVEVEAETIGAAGVGGVALVGPFVRESFWTAATGGVTGVVGVVEVVIGGVAIDFAT